MQFADARLACGYIVSNVFLRRFLPLRVSLHFTVNSSFEGTSAGLCTTIVWCFNFFCPSGLHKWHVFDSFRRRPLKWSLA